MLNCGGYIKNSIDSYPDRNKSGLDKNNLTFPPASPLDDTITSFSFFILSVAGLFICLEPVASNQLERRNDHFFCVACSCLPFEQRI